MCLSLALGAQGIRAVGGAQRWWLGTSQMDKSFLFLFFKKESASF
jgi:hypothetical protein